MLADLVAEPGVEEILVLRSGPLGFLALHGGTQDRGTDLIAARAAEASASSLYAIVQPPGIRHHLPSPLHDPAESERLAGFLDHVDLVISVHGYGHGRDGWRILETAQAPRGPKGQEPPLAVHRGALSGYAASQTILVGGRRRDLAAVVADALRSAMPRYPVVDDPDAIPTGVRGSHPANPVNLSRGGGVQVELPPGPRGLRHAPDEGRSGEVPEELEVTASALAGAAVRLACT